MINKLIFVTLLFAINITFSQVKFQGIVKDSIGDEN